MTLAMKFQEKYEDGFVEGKLDTLVTLVLDDVITVETAAQRANMTVEEFSEYLEQ